MASLKGVFLEIKEIVNTILSRKIDFNAKILSEFDFKRKEREYYLSELGAATKKLEAVLSESFVVSPNDAVALTKTAAAVRELKQSIMAKNFLEAIVNIEKAYALSPNVSINEDDLPRGDFFLPSVPREIYSEVKGTFDEILKCYEHNCYRSGLILCGRILEIALHKKYSDFTKIDLLEKSPDIGLGNLILKFKEKGIELDPGLSNQIHLINQLRVASVHKKKRSFNPTRAQCKASILYTLDVLKKLFK